MGIVGFGRDFGNLDSGAENHAITMMKQSLKMMGQVKPTPWLMNIMLAIPGAGGAMKQFNSYCSRLVYQKQVNWKAKSAEEKAARPNDLMDWLLKTNEEGGPSALPTEEALHEEIRVLVVAGSDTAHGGMTNALFYLSQRPDVYAMLQRRIDDTFPGGPSSFDYKTLASNPPSIELLDAIINETLRLKPGVPSGNPRVTPASGLLIPGGEPCKGEGDPVNHGNGNLWIPGDVDIFMPAYLVQRDERYFEKADMWLPERWLKSEESKGLIKDRNAWLPFQVGKWRLSRFPTHALY
ncbi:Cytochrome P450 [Macrophomina phaseolina MS6]|uniref:Cytochrome P450 n=1 Tax=Macrophomina phaseolina (strain MS6) TaxID=1126212 RepID=K2QH68_MACPH|nr:Cytochrome P450 [Macrophomina phaseolina MS6]